MSDEHLFQVDPPQKSSKGSSKLVIGLAIGCGGMLLLCCGGVALIGWYGQSMLKEMVSSDPVTIAQKTAEITEIAIPEGMEPQFVMDMKIPMVDRRVMLMTAYAGLENREDTLIVVQFSEEMGGANNRQKMDLQMRQALREQKQEQGHLELEEAETFVHKVRGVEATFSIASGLRNETEAIWQVSGSFEGKSGPAFISLTLDKEKMTREEVEAFIKSIQ